MDTQNISPIPNIPMSPDIHQLENGFISDYNSVSDSEKSNCAFEQLIEFKRQLEDDLAYQQDEMVELQDENTKYRASIKAHIQKKVDVEFNTLKLKCELSNLNMTCDMKLNSLPAFMEHLKKSLVDVEKEKMIKKFEKNIRQLMDKFQCAKDFFSDENLLNVYNERQRDHNDLRIELTKIDDQIERLNKQIEDYKRMKQEEEEIARKLQTLENLRNTEENKKREIEEQKRHENNRELAKPELVIEKISHDLKKSECVLQLHKDYQNTDTSDGSNLLNVDLYNELSFSQIMKSF